jgi:hypothetical protein
MDEQLIDLYHRHVGMGFDRQERFAAFLDKKGAGTKYEYDPAAATLRFGKLAFEAPILGTHAFGNNSWLWAWSNKNLRLTITNRAIGDAVRAIFHRIGVHMLTHPGFSIEPLLGPTLTQSAEHVLGVILVAELGYDAYFTMPHDGHCELVLIRDDRLKVAEKHPLVRVAMTFPQALQAMPVLDHKAALTAYARDHGLTVSDQRDVLKVTGDGKGELTATFDDRGRLTKLEGVEIPKPKPKAAKKPAAKPPTKKKVAKKPAAKKPAVKKAAAKVTKATAKKPARKPAKKVAAKGRKK